MEALCQLGGCYHQGMGVPQSYERAAELFKLAAAGGDKIAAGTLRALGEAVPPGF